jgi:hypothetical protein
MADIIKLDPNKSNQLSRTFKKTEKRYCPHDVVMVDQEERMVRCEQCNSVIEPFDYVVSLANNEGKHWWNLKELERQIKLLTETKGRLEKDVINLKSQKRRLF